MEQKSSAAGPVFRLLICLGAALLATTTAHAETYIAGQYVVGSPQAELRTPEEARALALQTARELPGAFVVRGTGDSMLPLYPSGTFLVVQPQPYEGLSRGMTVVFRNGERSITHLLVAKTGDGWRTAGLNNRRHDYMAVHAGNIRGVVVAAFTPVTGKVVVMR